jgi:predicted PurR-regulated permease PerM
VTTPGFEPADLSQISSTRPYDIVAWLLTGIALLLVLLLHLLPAFVAGFVVYELVHVLARALKIFRIHHKSGQLAAVGIMAFGVVLLLTMAGAGIIAFVQTDNLPKLFNRLTDSIESWRAALPDFIAERLPADVAELRQAALAWLGPHAEELKQMGAEAGRTLAQIFFGLGIGVLASLHDVKPHEPLGPLGSAMRERVVRLGEAFRRVVFAQTRISAVNTFLTAFYLFVVLRLAGVHLPLAKTVLIITFLVGLLPVVGNLVSNAIIVVLSLSVSLSVAVASLIFLIGIHKLEYFLNALMIGSQVHDHAWELLLAMLVMEAAFGIPGLIAAPIYYAYVKDELVSRRLV